jgi:hypothetical protein
LQDHQNNITWKRQNRFSTTEFRLQTMRDCLKEFALASTFAGEAFERGRRLLETRASPAALAAFDREFRDLQDRRFQQNARVSALMLYFKDGQGATAVYQRYVELSSDFLRQLETAVHLKASGATPDVDSLENAMAAVYGAAAATEDKIRKEIGMEEDENEKYRL